MATAPREFDLKMLDNTIYHCSHYSTSISHILQISIKPKYGIIIGANGRIRTYGPVTVDTLAVCWFKPLTHVCI